MSSLLQLLSYGAQDIYLTSNANYSLFNTTYNRHTNFTHYPQLPKKYYLSVNERHPTVEKLFELYGYNYNDFRYELNEQYIIYKNELDNNQIRFKFLGDKLYNFDMKCKYELINNSLLDEENKYYCPVLFNEIEYGDKYIKCKCCNKCFSFKVKEFWINSNNNCPHCRQRWTDKNIYINEDKNDERTRKIQEEINILRAERKEFKKLRKRNKVLSNYLKDIKFNMTQIYDSKYFELKTKHSEYVEKREAELKAEDERKKAEEEARKKEEENNNQIQNIANSIKNSINSLTEYISNE